MSDAKSPPELSMDEILAQIRRIIAEDEQPGATSTISGAPITGAPISGGAGSRTGGAAGVLDRGKAAEAAGDASDDILELTEAINEDGSVRHLAPIGGNSPIVQLREPAPMATRVEREPEPELAAERREAPSHPPAAEQTIISGQTVAPGQAGTPGAAVTPGQTGTTEQRPISDAAASAATFAALGSVPREARPDPEQPIGAADRTIEDIVRELLRPVLQTWLDEHLPKIVERLVQAEIARIVKPGPG